ncbi:winged helix-turn-helix domain-containing protein [Terricaulis silvestris]|uniref:Transcriptional activator CadC n=1 Tax=Terricaulis silvestris TaxID=2686094 RepID=A0A6I6MMG9_9CAUL|nr:transcriptional regulator [Terricaulis silvestris]QGZ96470.1 Transcriptional activator CadC [Terricaulis silvestris]
MASGAFRFDRFRLDLQDRQLTLDDAPVELNSRYLDALALLVREQGKLVSKERFLEEVWRGVPVTDEALTQCIKTLRRQLGDDAASPRFIETVPKHGYRFIAPVTSADRAGVGTATAFSWRQFFVRGGAGALGGGVAGVFVGLFYGFAGAQAGAGGLSALLVLVVLCILLGLIAAAGVGFGIAAAAFSPRQLLQWSVIGGGFGGLIVGAFGKLLGLDAFNLLLGQTPGEITGAAEGAIVGGAVGLGAWLGARVSGSFVRRIAPAALAGGAAGAIIPVLGGRMLGGSLDLLSRQFPNSRLQVDQIGALFGESGFGSITQSVTGGVEGGLFAACVVGAMIFARQRFAAL